MEGERFVNGMPYWFNPDAFLPPADGNVRQFRTRAVSPAWPPPVGPEFFKELLPDRNGPPAGPRRVINAFDQRQWAADPNVVGLDNTCRTWTPRAT